MPIRLSLLLVLPDAENLDSKRENHLPPGGTREKLIPLEEIQVPLRVIFFRRQAILPGGNQITHVVRLRKLQEGGGRGGVRAT